MNAEHSLELHVIRAQMEQLCAFSLGKKRIRDSHPSFEPLMIRRLNEWIREALEAVRKYDTMPFAGIRDISEPLQNAEKGRILTAQDILNEIQFIQGVRGILVYQKGLSEVSHVHLDDLINTLIVHQKCETFLRKCINEYGEVMDSATPELAAVRSALRRIDGEIASVAQRFLQAHGDAVVDSIITYRGGRAVVLVRASEKNSFGGMIHGDSSSGQASYVEPASFVAVNNRKQELLNRQDEEVQRVLRMCTDAIGEVAAEELANLETCAILDEIFAKAQWGDQREACAAVLSETSELKLTRARHPLIDPEKVVANSYHLADPCRVLLITGPNTGGKTVSMKVIGLSVLMTYAGMPVTADEAVIPFFDRIFVDIGDDQSVVSSLSSFSAHIQKQAEMCRSATADSLILLDEVGSGTDPREGEALAIAILNELRERHCMTVATTHYGRLKAYGRRHDDILVASVEFDMQKLAPTYRYMEGTTGQSNALEVAQRYGLPSSIIKYARFLKDQSRSEEDRLIERLETQVSENTRLQEELQKKIAQAEEKEARLKKEENRLAREKDRLKAQYEKEAQEYLESVQEEADAILARLRSQQDVKYHEMIELRHEIDGLREDSQQEEVPERDYEYKVGDAVELRDNDQVCEVIKIGRKDLTILMNGREIRVKKNQIRPSTHIIPKMKKQPSATIHIASHDIFASMPSQCNLIGMRVDEAMEAMADYFDQAKLHGLKNFRIIHGDGTGRLRKAVHEKLRNDPSVKEFRLGMPQEGGTGATVVELK